jgi:hypothetical protein
MASGLNAFVKACDHLWGGQELPMDLCVGTSGYSYKEWKGKFYPKDLPARQMLPFYGSKPAKSLGLASTESCRITSCR